MGIARFTQIIMPNVAYMLNTDKVQKEKEFHFTEDPRYIVVLLFYVHGKHLRSCRDGQLT